MSTAEIIISIANLYQIWEIRNRVNFIHKLINVENKQNLKVSLFLFKA